MSDIRMIGASSALAKKADTRLAEIQEASKGRMVAAHEGADDLLFHGWVLTRLPRAELEAVVARAREILTR